MFYFFFFFQAEDGIRDSSVTGVQTCALPISARCTQSYGRPLLNAWSMACQRLPIRLTGPPRFIGVPRRTPTPGHRPRGAPRLARPAAAAVRRPALRHPTGYATYWQYTTALACSALVATNQVISSADNAIESFILA